MQQAAGKIRGLQTEIVALSTDDALQTNRTTRELGVRFPLLSDSKKRIIQLYGVLHPREGMARPAIFIIDKRGVVRYVHVGSNFRDRPSLQQLMQALAFL